MTAQFDPALYVRPPVLDVPSGVALGVALLTALPHGAPDHVRAAARALRKGTVALQTEWAKSYARPPQKDRRKADTRIDNAWGILLDRLVAYAHLPADTYPRTTRASELVDVLSPDGRAWLALAYSAEWAESDRRLKQVDAEGLASDINALAGPEFLAEVRAAHVQYGEALGITHAAEPDPEVNLAEPLRALAQAVTRYSFAVASTFDGSPATAAVAHAALNPIDLHRAQQSRRAIASADSPAPAPTAAPPATPTTPVPEVH